MRSADGRLDTKRIVELACLGALVAVGVYAVICAFEPPRTNWGDPWSDGNAQSAGRVFAERGFLKTSFTPILDVHPLQPDALVYTHYPPLPDLINGVLQTILGARDIAVYRLFALLLSGGALYFFYRYVATVWNRTAGLVATALLGTNMLFLQFADCIHHVPIYSCFGFASLAASAKYLKSEGKGLKYAVLGAVAAFFSLLASYDFYLFLPFATLATVFLTGHKVRDKKTIAILGIVAIGCIGSFATKCLLVMGAVGKKAFIDDLVFQFFERATEAHSEAYKEAIPLILVTRIWRFFGPIFFVILGSHVLVLVDRLRGTKRPGAGPLWYLFAGILYIQVFSQLFAAQYHPTLLLLPYLAIGGGLLWSNVADKPGRDRILVVGLLATTLVWQVIELVRLEKTFLPREDIAAVRKHLDANDKQRFLLTNLLADGPVRYYWDRYPLPLPLDHEALEMRNLFDVYGDSSPITAVEMLDLREEAYDKWIYAYFAPERRWNWIANPFPYRHEWRERVSRLHKNQFDCISRVGKVVYESKTLRVWSIEKDDLDRRQAAQIPREQTTMIDFETRFADRYKISGWGWNEQFFKEPGFSWMLERRPSRMVFTLKGLKDVEIAPPIRTSGLRVRLKADASYELRAVGWTDFDDQVFTLSINGHPPVEAKYGKTWDMKKEYRFRLPKEHLRTTEEGLQELAFSYTKVGSYHNGVMFHWVYIDPVSE